jgi:hypothetical protein
MVGDDRIEPPTLRTPIKHNAAPAEYDRSAALAQSPGPSHPRLHLVGTERAKVHEPQAVMDCSERLWNEIGKPGLGNH